MTELERWLSQGNSITVVAPERIRTPFWGKQQFARKVFHRNTGLAPMRRETTMPDQIHDIWKADPDGVTRYLENFGKK